MAAYNNVIILMLASLVLRSVISDSPAASPLSPLPQPPSVIDVPTPSPVEPPSPTPQAESPVESPAAPTPQVESPVEPPAPTPTPFLAPTPSPVRPPAPSPVESPKPSPANSPSSSPPSSIWMAPAEAPAPESNAGLKRVSVGLVCFGAFVVAFMA